MKIAIVGGTFDPIHEGHKEMARAALKELQADEVWFMPAQLTPLKDRQITNALDRKHMLDLALQDEPAMKVCDLELKRQGRSYTIDTVRELKELYPEHDFTWLIGADQLAQFDKWKDADQLVELMDFGCFMRDGMKLKSKFPIRYLDMKPMDVSSSEIRRGEKLEYLHPDVLNYIYERNLYLYDFVACRMNEKRFHHSLMVAAIAQALAAAHGMDAHKAYLMGLFHDITKYLPYEQNKEWMTRLGLNYEDYPVATWHGFTGAAYTKEVLKLADEDIYEAIYHHVFGSSDNGYAMILFIADKLEPLRPYDSSSLLRLCMNDLPEGFEAVKNENRKYLEEKGK